jgi:lysophospholipase L1-like esterase
MIASGLSLGGLAMGTIKRFAGTGFCTLMICGTALAQQEMQFTCGGAGGKTLSAEMRFDAAAGAAAYGFDLMAAPTSFAKGACSSDKAFFFSMAATDGDYRVTLVLGGPEASTTTVRAESRRLIVDELKLVAKSEKSVVFNVNVRTDKIAGAAPTADGSALKVKLKPREIGALDWDNKLTLEFNGEHPSVKSIAIKKVDVPTVYLAGDSTNEAESGETIKSFVGERRLAKIESTWKRGDYLLVQFAHNDQKPGSGFVSIDEYKTIMRRYISDARAKGVTPILVTAMNRRKFDADGKIVATLGEYPQATRDVAAEQKVGLIDLNATSKTLFEAIGEEGTLKAFVHFPANTFPEQPEELKDDTHFTSYGAYELARAVVQSIRDQKLPLEKYLKPGIPVFDPAKPLPFSEWHLPASPFVSTSTPYGR